MYRRMWVPDITNRGSCIVCIYLKIRHTSLYKEPGQIYVYFIKKKQLSLGILHDQKVLLKQTLDV